MVHLRRGWLGWRQAHAAHAAMADPLADAAPLREKLATLAAPWKLPRGMATSVVAAADVLGVLPPGAGASALPFDAAEVSVQVMDAGRAGAGAALWIHKDWLHTLDTLCESLGWVLVEVFARGQLAFSRPVAKNGVSGVLEAGAATTQLHWYGSRGALLRSTTLDAAGAPAFRRAEAEALSMAAGLGQAEDVPVRIAVSGAEPPASPAGALQWSALPAVDEARLLVQLALSSQPGIVVRERRNPWRRNMKVASAVLAGVGAAAYAALLWHDGQLQTQIDTQERWIRRQQARYDQLSSQQAEARQLQNVSQGKQAQLAVTPASAALGALLSGLPDKATLSTYSYAGGAVQIAGTGASSEAVVKVLGQAPGFSAVRPVSNAELPEGDAFSVEAKYSPAPAPQGAEGKGGKPAEGRAAS